MVFNATVSLTPQQLREIICSALKERGITNISHQDIVFVVGAVERGDQRDPWTTHELARVDIKNVEIGDKI